MPRFLIALLIIASPLFANAREGGMVGNGGDSVLQDFNLRGLQLANYFATETAVANKYGIDAAKFLATVKSTKLEGVDQLVLRGIEVDAINYPSEKRIEISRKRWVESAARLDSFFAQRRIALHEYLWVYGINDEGYVVSNGVIAEFEKSVGVLGNPMLSAVIYQQLCETLASPDGLLGNRFEKAKQYIAWGLDLDRECASETTSGATPLEFIFQTYADAGVAAREERVSARRQLIGLMLRYGLNPNSVLSTHATEPPNYYVAISGPLLLEAQRFDPEMLPVLFAAGADPNLRYEVSTSVSWEQNIRSVFIEAGRPFPVRSMTPQILKLYLKAGGDLNQFVGGSNHDWASFTAVDAITTDDGNPELVEALIQTKRVDWCGNFDPMQRNSLDRVHGEYRSIFEKYGISCPVILKGIWAYGCDTCSDTFNDASKKCAEKNFNTAVMDPYEWGKEPACDLPKIDKSMRASICLNARYHCVNK